MLPSTRPAVLHNGVLSFDAFLGLNAPWNRKTLHVYYILQSSIILIDPFLVLKQQDQYKIKLNTQDCYHMNLACLRRCTSLEVNAGHHPKDFNKSVLFQKYSLLL